MMAADHAVNYQSELDRELKLAGIKDKLQSLFDEHPELISMSSISDMSEFLTECNSSH